MTKEKVLCAAHRDHPLPLPTPCIECSAETSLGCRLCMSCAALRQECQVCRTELPSPDCEKLRTIAVLSLNYESAVRAAGVEFEEAIGSFADVAAAFEKAQSDLADANKAKVACVMEVSAHEEAEINKLFAAGADQRAVEIAKEHRYQAMKAVLIRQNTEVERLAALMTEAESALLPFREQYDAALLRREQVVSEALACRDAEVSQLIGWFYGPPLQHREAW
jgi:hypothetical protein